jgi:hypothetical protein
VGKGIPGLVHQHQDMPVGARVSFQSVIDKGLSKIIPVKMPKIGVFDSRWVAVILSPSTNAITRKTMQSMCIAVASNAVFFPAN